MRKSVAAVMLLIAVASAVWWYQGRREETGNPLAYVPADTPYVFAANKALSADQARAMLRQYGLSSDVLAMLVEPVKAALLAGDSGNGELGKLIAAFESEFAGKDLEQIHAVLGVRLGGRNVLYGVGLTPVLRMELDQPQAFAQSVARIEQHAGQRLAQAKIGEHEYWYLPLGQSPLRLVMAVIDSTLVLSLASDPAPDAATRAVLGLDLPDRSLQAAGTLDTVIADYGLHSGIAGYIDSTALLHATTAPLSAPDSALQVALGMPQSQPGAQCSSEFGQIADAMPRLVVGYTQVGDRQVEALSVLQLRADIASNLMRLRAPMPGLDAVNEDSVLDLGVSIALQQVPAVIGALVKATEQTPWQCPELTSLNDAAKNLKTLSTNPALLGSAAMVRSVFAVINRLQWPNGAAMPDVAGALVVAGDNPASLLGIARSMAPALGAVQLKADSQPVPLPAMPELGLQAPMFAAMSDNALAVSIGAGEENAMPQLLRSDDAQQPLLVIGMNSALYVDIAQWNLRQLAADASPEARAKAEQDLAIARIYPSMFKRTRVRMDITERGIEFSQQSVLP
jgi:hypothetical protein